jgi:short-chain Z-isoprenyl diphosphate synthase
MKPHLPRPELPYRPKLAATIWADRRLPRPLYRFYERQLTKQLGRDIPSVEEGAARLETTGTLPRHVGVILDGNRRWAASFGKPAATGHRAGADKIQDFLGWAEDLRIEVVTLWMLSTDNLSRSGGELGDLLEIIDDAVTDLAASGRWRLRVVGRLDLLPPSLAASLRAAETVTAEVDGLQVNVAVGYGGRAEIADAVKGYLVEQLAAGATLAEVASQIDVDDIDRHLYTAGQPEPDLVIRTSGEQRIGGFLMWQSAHSELYFCEAYWPGFRRVDFLRAVRDFVGRERRLGK